MLLVLLLDELRQQLRRCVRVDRLTERGAEHEVRFGPLGLNHEPFLSLPSPVRLQHPHRQRVDSDCTPPATLGLPTIR